MKNAGISKWNFKVKFILKKIQSWLEERFDSRLNCLLVYSERLIQVKTIKTVLWNGLKWKYTLRMLGQVTA